MHASLQQLLLKAAGGTGAGVHTAAVALAVAVQTPLCIFGSFRTVSGVSVVGCLTSVAIISLIALLPLLDPRRECLPDEPVHHIISLNIFPATSIFAARCSSSRKQSTSVLFRIAVSQRERV